MVKKLTWILLLGCRESYEDSESLYACVVGCKSQDLIPSPETYLEVIILIIKIIIIFTY